MARDISFNCYRKKVGKKIQKADCGKKIVVFIRAFQENI